MGKLTDDLVLLQRIALGQASLKAPVTIRQRSIARRYDVHRQLREELETMAWSLSQPWIPRR